MAKAADVTNTRLMIGPGRLSYPHLLEPQQTENGPRFSMSLLLPPSTDVAPIKAALKAAWVKKFGADQTKWPKGDTVRTPDKVIKLAENCFRAEDGSRLYGDEFNGWYVIPTSCGADYPPEVVDGNTDTVTDKREVYPGRWARATVNAFGYVNRTRGVTLGLNNVQILKNDTPLGGKARAKSEFDVVAEDLKTDGGSDEQWD